MDNDFEQTLHSAQVVGVLRASTPEAAIAATRAAVEGGLRAIEITFTTPEAPRVLHVLSQQSLPLLLGAGTVMTREQGQAALEAGAQFLVSPHLGEDLLALAHEQGVPYIPGVLTPTEICQARRLGARVVKLFPIGSSGGRAYLKDLLGPFPGLKAMVTGGVEPSEVPAYRSSGAMAVGLGSNLFPKQALEQSDFTAVRNATAATLRDAGALP